MKSSARRLSSRVKSSRKKTHLKRLPFNSKGKVAMLVIIFIAITLGMFLTGGIFPTVRNETEEEEQDLGLILGTCCDKGDGDACEPYTEVDKTITYGGEKYGLLKSGIKFSEQNWHLKDSGEKTDAGDPIILNDSPLWNNAMHIDDAPQCQGGDAYHAEGTFVAGRRPYPNCFVIPDDQIVYVCRENCVSSNSDDYCSIINNIPYFHGKMNCYGDTTSKYDAYFKLSDFRSSSDIPEQIRNCDKKIADNISTYGQQLVLPSGTMEQKSVQLNTFKIIQPSPVEGAVKWLSPWCKPAIYLYPEEKTNVQVQVYPVGKMMYTDPIYPNGGWNVTAHPDGRIDYKNASYDYLYYEAEIPNTSYEVPEKGFVIEYSQLSKKLSTILSQLGLNQKEKNQFIEYWVKVLPKAKFYFIAALPQEVSDSLAPLSIFPQPDKIIRVNVYFEALDSEKTVEEPSITPVSREVLPAGRQGFTVVEWGGIFKRDKKHPFSCFM